MVESMAGFGIPQRDIAKALGIAYNTLRLNFADELESGAIKTNTNVVKSLYEAATSKGPGSVAAAIYWTKVRMGWREPPQQHKHSGAIGSYDLSKMTDEQLNQLEKLLGPLTDNSGDQRGKGPAGGGEAA